MGEISECYVASAEEKVVGNLSNGYRTLVRTPARSEKFGSELDVINQGANIKELLGVWWRKRRVFAVIKTNGEVFEELFS